MSGPVNGGRSLADGTGNTIATYTYDVFGAIRTKSGSGAVVNEWRFTGEQRDPQGSRNFYYLRARYYDPAIGRFLTQDPLLGSPLLVQARNAYTYVENNPLNRLDPSGLVSESSANTTFTCIAAGLALAAGIGFLVVAVGAGLPAGIYAALAAGALLGLFAYNIEVCIGLNEPVSL